MYKTLLVHVDSTEACVHRMALAASVARANEGRLVGVYSSARDLREDYDGDEGSPWLTDAARAEAAFHEVLQSESLPGEWVRPQRGGENEIVVNGRYADLVVIGEPDPDDSYTHVAAAHPERVVLSVGRPVLIVPYIGAPSTAGRHVLVAWDASSPAVRALHDAMPFLRRAKRVTLLSINPPSLEGPDGNIGERMRESLLPHGVEARVERTFANRGMGVADALLDWATDNSDDLIVMGVHPGRRFGERIIDGPARKIIEQMTLPVFMSN